VRLPEPPLLLVTDRRQARIPLPELIEAAFAAGCRWASLREKDLPKAEQLAMTRHLLPLARRFDAKLILHGDPALAQAAGCDGVHLPAGGDAKMARALLGPSALVGVSIHDLAEAAAFDPALDYVIVGPVRETASKPGYGPSLGFAGLAALAAATRVPIIAIGGIDAAAIPEILASGAAGVAVMGGIMRAANPAVEVKGLIAALCGR
jgi:thiamine-phosphate pyrophosphorylase